jgi:hypothetical protein
MKYLISAVAVLSFTAVPALADTYTRGYTRNSGTYVPPHYQSSPDRSYNNNWSVSPNANPYTGQRGTNAPTFNDRPPSVSPYANPYDNNRRR